MKPRIKLLTLWVGPLPKWFGGFYERIKANKIVDWEIARLGSSVDQLTAEAEVRLCMKCRKETAYSLCDLRPALARIMPDLVKGYEWWGWCDLDIAVGNLDRILPPLLDERDIITTDARAIHGPLTLLRNVPEVNDLFQLDGADEVFADPDYWNFDETGFNDPDDLGRNGNPSYTSLVKASGLRVEFDDRCWTEGNDTINGLPLRCCRVIGGRELQETPGNRRLMAYHFSKKRWKMADEWYRQWPSLQTAQHGCMTSPSPPVEEQPHEESPERWSARVRQVLEHGQELHRIVLDTPIGDWERIQGMTTSILCGYLKDGDRILDAGCSYGALTECLSDRIEYTGLDWCPDMIDLATRTYPNRTFRLGNLDAIPAASDKYDWVVCRGLEGSIRTILGCRRWIQLKTEMLRTTKNGIILIDDACNHRIIAKDS
jgi:SAM-dependent methyltransferase